MSELLEQKRPIGSEVIISSASSPSAGGCEVFFGDPASQARGSREASNYRQDPEGVINYPAGR